MLAAVADGIGGWQGGQEASRLAISVIDRTLGESVPDLAALVGAVAAANRAVYESGIQNPDLAGMGTTLTVGAISGVHLFVAHVGDSRAYRVTHGGLEQLTHDHSMAAEMERSGTLSPEEAAHHPQRHILTRAIGPYDQVTIDVWDRPWAEGDRLLLCSDGLFKAVSESRLNEQLQELNGQAAVDALIQMALDEGGTDNVTVVLVESIPRLGRPHGR